MKLVLLGMYRKIPRKVDSIGQNKEGQGRARQDRSIWDGEEQGRADAGQEGMHASLAKAALTM